MMPVLKGYQFAIFLFAPECKQTETLSRKRRELLPVFSHGRNRKQRKKCNLRALMQMDVCEAAVEIWLVRCSGGSPPLHIKGRTTTPTSVVKQHDIIHYYLIVWQRRVVRGVGLNTRGLITHSHWRREQQMEPDNGSCVCVHACTPGPHAVLIVCTVCESMQPQGDQGFK